jgi:RNA polymerase sigma-70 factor (ECF subfamily)
MSEDELRRAAVERAYREHADDVYRVAYAILRDADDASDAVHETFARAHRSWERYDDRRPLGPWLNRIGARVALDATRRRRVRSIRAVRLDDGGAAAGDAGAGDPSSVVERRRLVEDGLDTLRPEARAALVLRHYHGYDYAEIAAALGTSPGNVGSILSRAHAALRVLMTERPAAEPLAPGDDRVAIP